MDHMTEFEKTLLGAKFRYLHQETLTLFPRILEKRVLSHFTFAAKAYQHTLKEIDEVIGNDQKITPIAIGKTRYLTSEAKKLWGSTTTTSTTKLGLHTLFDEFQNSFTYFHRYSPLCYVDLTDPNKPKFEWRKLNSRNSRSGIELRLLSLSSAWELYELGAHNQGYKLRF
jgi:hypothetical protein